MSGGGPNVAEALQAHTSVICLQRPSLPTARLNGEPKISVHHRPLVSGWKIDTDETSNGIPLQYSCPENPMDRGAW